MNQLIAATLIFASFAVPTSAVDVKFELKLDSKPQESAFELRGPLPSVDIVDEAAYFSLSGESIERRYNLTEGKFYYLMLLDSGKDGIKDGSFKLSANYEQQSEVTLKEGDCKFGHGKVWNFLVPAAPVVGSKKNGLFISQFMRGSSKWEHFSAVSALLDNCVDALADAIIINLG